MPNTILSSNTKCVQMYLTNSQEWKTLNYNVITQYGKLGESLKMYVAEVVQVWSVVFASIRSSSFYRPRDATIYSKSQDALIALCWQKNKSVFSPIFDTVPAVFRLPCLDKSCSRPCCGFNAKRITSFGLLYTKICWFY